MKERRNPGPRDFPRYRQSHCSIAFAEASALVMQRAQKIDYNVDVFIDRAADCLQRWNRPLTRQIYDRSSYHKSVESQAATARSCKECITKITARAAGPSRLLYGSHFSRRGFDSYKFLETFNKVM